MAGQNKPALVALRDRREATIEWLTEQFARDVLDLEEFEDRVDRAHRASSIAALDELLADLEPMPEQELESPDPPEQEAPDADPSTALAPPATDQQLMVRPEKRRALAVMGGVERKGAWLVPRQLRAVAVMGGIDLDFREVQLPPGVTEIKVTAIMGGVEIIVPPHLAVSCDGIGIMGGFEGVDRMPTSPEPDSPLLVISGVAFMGGVDVKTRLPGESAWQAHKRRRRERRELRHRHRRELRDRRGGELRGDDDRKQLGDGE